MTAEKGFSTTWGRRRAAVVVHSASTLQPFPDATRHLAHQDVLLQPRRPFLCLGIAGQRNSHSLRRPLPRQNWLGIHTARARIRRSFRQHQRQVESHQPDLFCPHSYENTAYRHQHSHHRLRTYTGMKDYTRACA